MRDYSEVLRRIEVLNGDFQRERIGEAGEYPIYKVTVSKDASLPTIWINGGTHGDEPAGVEGALAFLESDQSRWLDRLRFDVTPCINPHGYVHDSRENGQGVDINWAFRREDVPEISVIKKLIDGKRFEAIVDLHEDWESLGFYLYEQFRDLDPVGQELTRRAAEVCSINYNLTIENEQAENGVIFPNLEVEKRRHGDGVPIGLFLEGYTDHLMTFETPTAETLVRRVRAHRVGLEVVIRSHYEGLGSL